MRRPLRPLPCLAALLALLATLSAPAATRAQALPAAGAAPGLAADAPAIPARRAPVRLDGLTVFWATAPDSAAAASAADSILAGLLDCRARLRDLERLTVAEQDAGALLRLDAQTVLVLRPENRVDEQRSPLANALALRRQLVLPLLTAGERGEEELALRLFLGVVFPLLLLVVLRTTRYGLRRWERRWRHSLREGLMTLAKRRRLDLPPERIHGILRAVTGLERLVTFGLIATLVAFLWFALFPETRPLALTLLNRGLGPLLDLLGATARGVLGLLYTLFVLALAILANRWLAGRWRRGSADPLGDPALHIPLRTGVWLLAIFLMLFPYAGAPRLFAVILLLLVILVALIAMRPVGEEIACGLYLNATHALRAGDRLRLTEDDETLEVLHLGLAQVQVRCEEGERWVPYSRMLKAKLTIQRGAGRRP